MCLESNKTILSCQQKFKSELHNVFTEKVSKIVLSVNGDERLQVIDRMILYPYGTGPGKVCKAVYTRLHPKMKN